MTSLELGNISEGLIQFQLQKKQAAERIDRMKQGDRSAFEEELKSLKDMRERALFRHAGDEIYCRTQEVIQLADEFSKEFSFEFRGLP